MAEFKQWPAGQMEDKLSPSIFRSLRLAGLAMVKACSDTW